MVLMRYSLFIVCKYSFMFFLKLINIKYLVIFLNGYFIVILILFIEVLKFFCVLLRCVFLKGFWIWSVIGYVGFLYMYKGLLCLLNECN